MALDIQNHVYNYIISQRIGETFRNSQNVSESNLYSVKMAVYFYYFYLTYPWPVQYDWNFPKIRQVYRLSWGGKVNEMRGEISIFLKSDTKVIMPRLHYAYSWVRFCEIARMQSRSMSSWGDCMCRATLRSTQSRIKNYAKVRGGSTQSRMRTCTQSRKKKLKKWTFLRTFRDCVVGGADGAHVTFYLSKLMSLSFGIPYHFYLPLVGG